MFNGSLQNIHSNVCDSEYIASVQKTAEDTLIARIRRITSNLEFELNKLLLSKSMEV